MSNITDEFCKRGHKMDITNIYITPKGYKNCRKCRNIGSKSFRRRKITLEPDGKYIHGMSKSTEYTIWRGIKMRCKNKNNHAFQFYGGRGIKICKRWDISFLNFYKDMGKRPSNLLSIERKNNNLGYNKKNCYWATKTEQSRNRRYTVWYDCEFGVITQHELSIKLDVDDSAISYRIKKGETISEIINHFKYKKHELQRN